MSDGEETPALQVIVLGSTGGPLEDNTTAFLVRSLSEDWRKGSVLAVDAGTHLSSISRIIEQHLPERTQVDEKTFLTTGPFSGLELPHISAKANAGHVTKAIVDTYLITHPHLDHISGLVVNTAALPGVRPKRIAALPSTISAFKNHIFNNVIWPNLSDENDGAGLVTYMRLVEGGSAALGNAGSRGYVEICDGLSIKTWSVSHGHCMENHWHRGSSVGHGRISHDSVDATAMQRSASNSTPGQRHGSPRQQYSSHPPPPQDNVCVYDSSAYFIRDIKTGREVLIFGDVEPDSISLSPRNHQVWTDAAPKVANGTLKAIFIECSYSDSRNDDTLFGHLAPRFLIEELLALAGHVDIAQTRRNSSGTPGAAQSPSDLRKRKRVSQTLSAAGASLEADMSSPAIKQNSEPWSAREVIRKAHRKDEANVSPHTRALPHPPNAGLMQLDSFELDARGPRPGGRDISQPESPFSPKHVPTQTSLTSSAGDIANTAPELSGDGIRTPLGKPRDLKGMLAGLKVVIIHVKDNLDDNEPAEDTILREMNEYEQQEKLGCHFEIARAGMSVLL
ncbi:3',5'-cyclic-nucleotide phosphodiesterase pde1 [Pseudogymnoascus australis]